ncbi:MAG: SH3 domain-containing protein [Deltaproteobacteria bacterium]|nr:SH3 domain-containing protein [Deltaproteobacteria bacterium]
MGGHTIGRETQSSASRLIFALTWSLALSAIAPAQVSGRSPSILPNATIVSDETNATSDTEPPADEDVPPAVTGAPAPHSHPHHHVTMSEPSYSAAVEPTHAMLKLKNDAWAYAGPETSSSTLERVHSGKFLDVTGSTHYYVQVKLKSGETGYVPISAVELTRSQDKIMRLSTDAAVLSQPNRYGKRLSEVHQGHDVHVIGVSMNYIKIRMKSGLEGYIPMTAAE